MFLFRLCPEWPDAREGLHCCPPVRETFDIYRQTIVTFCAVLFPVWRVLTSGCEREEAGWCGCVLLHPSWIGPRSGANFPKTSPGFLSGALSPALDLGVSLSEVGTQDDLSSQRPVTNETSVFCTPAQSQSTEHLLRFYVTLYLPQSQDTDADPAYVSCSCVIFIASHWVSGEMVS